MRVSAGKEVINVKTLFGAFLIIKFGFSLYSTELCDHRVGGCKRNKKLSNNLS